MGNAQDKTYYKLVPALSVFSKLPIKAALIGKWDFAQKNISPHSRTSKNPAGLLTDEPSRPMRIGQLSRPYPLSLEQTFCQVSVC